MREPGKGQGLAHVHNVLAVNLVLEEGVPRRIGRGSVRWGQRLESNEMALLLKSGMRFSMTPHLGGNVVVEMAGVFWVAKTGLVRRCFLVNVDPVDPAKPWVSL